MAYRVWYSENIDLMQHRLIQRLKLSKHMQFGADGKH